MLFLLRTLLLTFSIAALAWSNAGAAVGDNTADPEVQLRALDPRPEAHMTLADLERRSAAGELSAQAELGARYGQGHGVNKDLAKAIGLLTPAAAKGNADAQFFLASAYAAGQGVPQNDLQAFMLCEQAAQQGHPAANYLLATMIISGRAGISPNWLGSIPYLWQSAVKDYPPAMFLLAAAYEDGKAGIVNPRAAAYWYRRYLSLFQDSRAMFNLRRMISEQTVPYEDGDPGGPPDALPAGEPGTGAKSEQVKP